MKCQDCKHRVLSQCDKLDILVARDFGCTKFEMKSMEGLVYLPDSDALEVYKLVSWFGTSKPVREAANKIAKQLDLPLL